MPSIKIIKGTVDRLAHPPKGQKLFMDEALKGFGVLVGTNTKTYVAQRDIGGRTVRVTLGRHGLITTAQARRYAEETLVPMRQGINPNAQKRAAQGRSITLQGAVDLYLQSSKPRAEKTIAGFRDAMRLHLKDWLATPLAEITRKMIYERHRRIGKISGPYAANATMRAFRAAYNRARRQHEELPANPIINVDWFPEYRRDASISAGQLAAWHKDIQALPNPIRRDFYLFTLFTGLRRQSAVEIRWEHINLDEGTLLIPNPKGGKKRAFVLPLSDFLNEVLQRRRVENEKLTPDSPWVFPSDKSRAGHIAEPKLTPAHKAQLEVPFSVHGLRHTWITAANAAGLSPYDIKMLANHMLPKGDVTAGYIGPHIEALRASQQRVTDYLRSLI